MAAGRVAARVQMKLTAVALCYGSAAAECYSSGSCGDCHNTGCSWSPPVGCLEDCSMIADVSCYGPSTTCPPTLEDCVRLAFATPAAALWHISHNRADGPFSGECKLMRRVRSNWVHLERARYRSHMSSRVNPYNTRNPSALPDFNPLVLPLTMWPH